VFHAKVLKKIPQNSPAGIQEGLNAIAKTEEFIKALEEEVKCRRLVPKAVAKCIRLAYFQASKHNQSNDIIITLRQQHHPVHELAVLAAFFKVQRGWPGGLEWKEVKQVSGNAH